MKIVVNEIPKNGLVLEQTGTAAELDVERDDISFRGPITVQADVRREFDSVHIRLRICGEIKFNCARCLKAGQQRIERDIEIIKPVEEENVIDLTQLAREEIILGYPDRLLCKDDCNGLCPRCGWNLNESRCHCANNDNADFHTRINL